MNFLRRVCANGMDADLIRLFRMLLPYKGLIALACIFLIGAASMSSLTATLLGKLTDLGFYQGKVGDLRGAGSFDRCIAAVCGFYRDEFHFDGKGVAVCAGHLANRAV